MRPIEVIAECGINHLGDMDLAVEMIRTAKEAGADVAKFQIYDPRVILDREHPDIKKWWDVILATELDLEKVILLKTVCDRVGIEFLASVFEPEKVAWTEEVGVQRYKIASRSVYDEELKKVIGATGKPVLVSFSAAYLHDVSPLFYSRGVQRLYCVSEYPTPLSHIKFTPGLFDFFAGFSDHTEGITAAVMAMSLGAKIIE